MSEVIRNNQNQILDTDGHPLEQVAAYNSAERRNAAATVEEKRELANAALRLSGSSRESYDAVGAQREAETQEAAANWKGFEHYNRNAGAYQEAAYEEDARRSAPEESTEEAPAPEVKQ
ncbi:MAG TPA: hypothetical protein VFS14_01265 [Candidatus Saccharimonadales bacterium]|nr:hypothetical protein [Candidatus Saccharimonadales bacterium]